MPKRNVTDMRKQCTLSFSAVQMTLERPVAVLRRNACTKAKGHATRLPGRRRTDKITEYTVKQTKTQMSLRPPTRLDGLPTGWREKKDRRGMDGPRTNHFQKGGGAATDCYNHDSALLRVCQGSACTRGDGKSAGFTRVGSGGRVGQYIIRI